MSSSSLSELLEIDDFFFFSFLSLTVEEDATSGKGGVSFTFLFFVVGDAGETGVEFFTTCCSGESLASD